MTTIFHIRPRGMNLGNDVIALATRALIEQAFGETVSLVTLPSVAANSSILGSGLSAANIYEINQLGDGLIIGGGNIFENGALNIDLTALGSLAVPTMLFSVSTGRIYGRSGRLAPRSDSMSKDRMLQLCRQTDLILVRDRATAAHLEGIGASRVQTTGCPTMFLDELLPDLPKAGEDVAGSILISLRHPKLMSIPYALQARVQQDIRAAIDLFRARTTRPVRLVCHDFRDLSFAAGFPDVPVLYTEDPLRFLTWVRGAFLNVTYRLHAFLPCLAYGTPSINISYDERAASLIDTVGLAEWDINMLQTRDLRAELEDRYRRLDSLEALRRRARPVWEGLRDTVMRGFADFASRVDAYRQTRVI